MANALPRQFKMLNDELIVEYSPDTKKTRNEIETLLKKCSGRFFQCNSIF